MEGDGVRLHTSYISMGDVTFSGDYKNFMLFLKNEKKNQKVKRGMFNKHAHYTPMAESSRTFINIEVLFQN